MVKSPNATSSPKSQSAYSFDKWPIRNSRYHKQSMAYVLDEVKHNIFKFRNGGTLSN